MSDYFSLEQLFQDFSDKEETVGSWFYIRFLSEESGNTPFLNTREITDNFTKKTGLIFIPRPETDSRVCFATDSELRDDFKIHFSSEDLVLYCFYLIHQPDFKKNYPNIPYPENEDEFLETIAKAKELKLRKYSR